DRSRTRDRRRYARRPAVARCGGRIAAGEPRSGVSHAHRKEPARLMSFIPLTAMVRKDLQLFFSDRRAVIMSFAVPIAIASFFGAIFSGSSDRDTEAAKIPVAIVDQDDSAISRGIVASAQADKTFKLSVMTAPTAVDDARGQVRRGKTTVGVIIPK